MSEKPLIGFIGQGYIGKNYADDFENRGYDVVRYAMEEPYVGNKSKIAECDIVFIAVPTPTTPEGYDASIIRKVIPLAREGKIVVLKSTILPGLTREIQKEFPKHTIVHSPEFLSEATVVKDVTHPFMNVVGLPSDSAEHKRAAELLHSIFPTAPFSTTVTSEEAELIKYSHNASGYTQIIFFNIMYDLARSLGADWSRIQPAIEADPYIPHRYAQPIHKSGRGAGGHCFIKDFSALSKIYAQATGDTKGTEVLQKMEEKNIELLSESKKDLDLLKGVYGDKAEIDSQGGDLMV